MEDGRSKSTFFYQTAVSDRRIEISDSDIVGVGERRAYRLRRRNFKFYGGGEQKKANSGPGQFTLQYRVLIYF